MIVDRFEKGMLVLDKRQGKIRLPRKSVCFFSLHPPPRTTPRPIPSAHQALARPHRELSKATPRQSNLFFPEFPGFPVSPLLPAYFSIRNLPQLARAWSAGGGGGL